MRGVGDEKWTVVIGFGVGVGKESLRGEIVVVKAVVSAIVVIVVREKIEVKKRMKK
jgi:tetrahydromethanopterin S-methyltransferase subunit E